jgi:hypothetical protein
MLSSSEILCTIRAPIGIGNKIVGYCIQPGHKRPPTSIKRIQALDHANKYFAGHILGQGYISYMIIAIAIYGLIVTLV